MEADTPAAPLFVVGCTRSGTTLLRDILARHPEQAMAMETGFFSKVWRPLRGRLPLSTADVQSALAALGWPAEARAGVAREFARGERGLGALYRCLLEDYARRQGKRRIGDKTPHHVLYLEPLFAFFPAARVIFMVRDPRAVQGSFLYHERHKGLARHDRSALGRALYWNLAYRRFAEQVRLRPQQTLRVRFEDLLRSPEAEVRRVCAFARLPFCQDLLEVGNRNSSFAASRSARPGFSQAPLDRGSRLSPAARWTIELLCGRFMIAEGYQPELVPRGWLRRLQRLGAYAVLDTAHQMVRAARAQA